MAWWEIRDLMCRIINISTVQSQAYRAVLNSKVKCETIPEKLEMSSLIDCQ